jgi:hypothetical protein
VQVENGTWTVEKCFLLCGHACAVRAEKQAQVHVRYCRYGVYGYACVYVVYMNNLGQFKSCGNYTTHWTLSVSESI